MRKFLHISFVVLLGLSVLAGCRREQMEEVLQTGNPVQATLTLDIRGFGGDGVVTKGETAW